MSRREQGRPGGGRREQGRPGGSRRDQEEAGGTRERQEGPGRGRRDQEEQGRAGIYHPEGYGSRTVPYTVHPVLHPGYTAVPPAAGLRWCHRLVVADPPA